MLLLLTTAMASSPSTPPNAMGEGACDGYGCGQILGAGTWF